MIDSDGNFTMSIQELIDNGMAWTLEGHVGRQCMAAIENGDAVLGRRSHRDYWGNRIPARWEVVPGSVGSQLYAHQTQLHPRTFDVCRRGTCRLSRRAPKP